MVASICLFDIHPMKYDYPQQSVDIMKGCATVGLTETINIAGLFDLRRRG